MIAAENKNIELEILNQDEKIKKQNEEIALYKNQLEKANSDKDDLINKISQLEKERDIRAANLKEEVAELNAKFEKAGLKISEKGVVCILDYSNYQKRVDTGFNRFKSELITISNDIDRIADLHKQDYSYYKKTIDGLIQESVALQELHNILKDYILNPPSKEFLALMNNTLAIRKIIQDYKDFEKDADITKLKSNIEEQAKIFNETSIKFDDFTKRQDEFFSGELKKIDNFKEKLSERLNQSGEKYNEFTTNMISNLEARLKTYQINLDTYQKIREDEIKYIKTLKKGGIYLTVLLALLCLTVGSVLGYAMFLVK